MLTYFEVRKRHPHMMGNLYKIRSWYFCGFLVYRIYEQLTTYEPLTSEQE